MTPEERRIRSKQSHEFVMGLVKICWVVGFTAGLALLIKLLALAW